MHYKRDFAKAVEISRSDEKLALEANEKFTRPKRGTIRPDMLIFIPPYMMPLSKLKFTAALSPLSILVPSGENTAETFRQLCSLNLCLVSADFLLCCLFLNRGNHFALILIERKCSYFCTQPIYDFHRAVSEFLDFV